ncbi:hypothetical protein C8R47DRAFT_420974 [Mycena vitilis]|nr:hypothetical protein C8R47DRAFT_420974 [Mycena vitilis]
MTLPLANFCDPRLLDLLFSSAPRWQSLEFCDYFSTRFRRMPPNTLANLTDVSIKIRGPLETHTSAVSAFLGAHQLCRVDLAVESTAHFPMPWAQLTHLTLSEISPQLSLDILSQCINICEADFRDMEPWAVEPDSTPLITLPQLERLGVYFQEHVDDAVHIMPFFARLELPALKDLQMWAGWENAWSSADFTQFQSGSPNLERISSSASYLEPDDLIALLLASRNLVGLGLDLCPYCMDDSVLELLQHTEQAAPVVPRLEDLCADYLEDDFSEGAMRKMVKSRWWTDAQLAAFSVPPAVARWKSVLIARQEEEYPAFSTRFKAKMDFFRSQDMSPL